MHNFNNSIIDKILLLLLITAINFDGFTQSILPNDQKIQYTGRIDFSNPLQPQYAFSGVSIKAKFNGTGIEAVIHDYASGGVRYTNYYKVLVDGTIQIEQLEVSNGDSTYSLVEGLNLGDHTIEIIKITEGFAGKSSFKGFNVLGGNQELLDLPERTNRRIEFIGDSWTAAFGNLSQFASGNASMVNGNFVAANQDVYYSWVAIAARALGAEFHVTATSGKGLYRNNDGTKTQTVPLMYDNTLERDAAVEYNHDSFTPAVVSIHIGTNDLAQEEGGQQFRLDDVAFEDTYRLFINKILGYHNCARILICFGNSKTDSWPTGANQLTRLRTIANNLKGMYPDGVVETLELPFTAEKFGAGEDCGYGDAWHPSLCSHEEMSEELIDKIEAMNIEWDKSEGCEPPTSTNQLIAENSVKISPNPVENTFEIVKQNNFLAWMLVNQNGQTVMQGNNDINRLSISNLPDGIYYLIGQDIAGKSIRKKIIKI